MSLNKESDQTQTWREDPMKTRKLSTSQGKKHRRDLAYQYHFYLQFPASITVRKCVSIV